MSSLSNIVSSIGSFVATRKRGYMGEEEPSPAKKVRPVPDSVFLGTVSRLENEVCVRADAEAKAARAEAESMRAYEKLGDADSKLMAMGHKDTFGEYIKYLDGRKREASRVVADLEGKIRKAREEMDEIERDKLKTIEDLRQWNILAAEVNELRIIAEEKALAAQNAKGELNKCLASEEQAREKMSRILSPTRSRSVSPEPEVESPASRVRGYGIGRIETPTSTVRGYGMVNMGGYSDESE